MLLSDYHKATRGNKFGAKRTTVGDTTYASRKEAQKCEEMKQMQRHGLITALELQPKYALVVNGEKIGTYIADARYVDKHGVTIVVDVKGGKATRTAVFQLKRKLVKALYGVEITII